MKIKTSELIDEALDWAVAAANGQDYYQPDTGPACAEFSTDWSEGGPIIERERITLTNGTPAGLEFMWHAQISTSDVFHQMNGPTPLVAAMRCYVASKLGNKVEIPQELLPG